MAGGKPGFVLSVRPRRYKTTKQQELLKDAAKACGIEKGITRAELVRAMKECIPKYYEEIRGQEEKPAP